MALPPAQRTAPCWNGKKRRPPHAHPREEHLLPLMVVLGAAENDAASVPYHEDAFMGALAVSSFRFG
jgi:aromatic ring-opening dioxygenase catalytic subunit (LigB family)